MRSHTSGNLASNLAEEEETEEEETEGPDSLISWWSEKLQV
jgi:hypothetical protein